MIIVLVFFIIGSYLSFVKVKKGKSEGFVVNMVVFTVLGIAIAVTFPADVEESYPTNHSYSSVSVLPFNKIKIITKKDTIITKNYEVVCCSDSSMYSKINVSYSKSWINLFSISPIRDKYIIYERKK
jgi:hypothetical protein